MTARTAPAADRRSAAHLAQHRGLVLTAALLAVLGTAVQTLFVPLLRLLPEEIGASPTEVSWLVTAVLLSGVISTALFGTLADRHGPRNVLLGTLLLLAAGSVLGALSSSLPALILARALQGTCMAALPIALGVLRTALEGPALVKALSLVGAMGSVGGSLGAVLGGVVGDRLGWRWLFAGSALVGVAMCLAVGRFVPHRAATGSGRGGAFGALGLGIALILLLLPVSEGSAWGWTSPLPWLIGVLGLGILTGWVRHQARATHPYIDIGLARVPSVLSTNLATCLIGFGMYGMVIASPQLAVLPAEGGVGLGATVLQAGLLSAPSLIILLAVPTVSRKLIAGVGAAGAVTSGAVVMAVGYASVLLWHSSLTALMVVNTCVTVGVSLCYAATPLLLNREVPSGRSGEANGLNGVFRIAGTSTSSAVVAAFLTTFTTGGQPSAGAFMGLFVLSGLVCLLVVPLAHHAARSPE